MTITPCTVRGEPMFKLEIRQPSGERKRRFFPTMAEAEKARKEALKDQAEVGKGWDIMSAREKSMLLFQLKEIQDKGFSLDQLVRLAQNPATPAVNTATVTLEQAITETIASKRTAKCREDYIDGLELYLKAFARGREKMLVSQIKPKDILDWFSGRNEADTTRNSNLGRLSSMFSYCWRIYRIENPCDAVETVRVDRKRPKTLKRKQYVKAMAWCVRKKPAFLGWLALALFVGLRPEAEADKIDWDRIDLRKGHILIEGDVTKVRSHERLIDLSLCPPAVPWLRLAKALGSPLNVSHSTRRRWLRDLRKCLGFKKWPQDVLRHTAASNMLAFHQDAGKVAKYLGNSPAVLLRDYADQTLSKEEGQQFMQLFPSWRHQIKAGVYSIT